MIVNLLSEERYYEPLNMCTCNWCYNMATLSEEKV